MKVELTNEQARKVAFDYILKALIDMKQYLDDTQIAKYRFMLVEFGTLIELEAAKKKFDSAWPNYIKWD